MRSPSRVRAGLAMIACAWSCSCTSQDEASTSGATDGGASGDAGRAFDGGASADGNAAADGDASAVSPDAGAPCATRVTYGSAWVHGANHPSSEDVTPGKVTWDGACTDDGPSSYALLSNGWKPYFQGNGACIIALDYEGACGSVPTCTTRVTYGPAWQHAPSHPAQYDEVAGRIFSDGICHDSGGGSYANISNGWAPAFNGNGACRLSFEHTQCGGLYANPVIPIDCPDPGVLRDANQYVLTCTSGGAADAYPVFTSPDLATFTPHGHIFPAGHRPSWATGDFWAPEIHKVGAQYVAYFSARHTDGQLSVGAASAPSPLGPFTDIGHPLVHDPAMGLIDASEITANGTHYVLWKEDGNARGLPTPIHAQALAADGLSLVGSPVTLITNDQAWEGPLVEGPFMVEHGGGYFLFYSANVYSTGAYAIGVARASSPLGPFTKAGAPILTSGGAWAGPGHCSVVDTPAGDTYMVYHSWRRASVGGAPGRLVLTDAVSWDNGWPAVPLAPSSTSRPLP